MSNKQANRAGTIREFKIFQAKDGGESIDASPAVTDIKYYENILSPSVNLTAIITETGESDKKSFGNKGMLDGLPIRGGNASEIIIEDHEGNKLKFKSDNKLYVNRVRNVLPGTQKDVYALDFTSRERLANEQCRVVKRYDGKISENVKKILTEAISAEAGLKTQKEVDVDETAIEYNFLGNDRKPFYVCTWLASKSIPAEAGKIGGAAGFLFFETHDGFKFKSIDSLIDQKSKGNYIFSNTADNPKSGEYKGKILSYTLDRDIDLQNNLSMGVYANRTMFFDFYAFNYKVRPFSVDGTGGSSAKEGAGSKDKIVTAGKDDIDSVADEFRLPVSRLMTRVLDVGSLPSGKDIKEQLEKWKDSPFDPTYDAGQTMVQSLMRYNQLFSIKINIKIAGDFSLRAGDMIYCEFPELTTDPNTPVNKGSGGLYMISSLCHNLTPRKTETSLTLVRDSFGRKPFKSD
tara:strand:+ start:216 stop:1598 length:1383 start_codon:yes stop_codon:yes gene_type:complete